MTVPLAAGLEQGGRGRGTRPRGDASPSPARDGTAGGALDPRRVRARGRDGAQGQERQELAQGAEAMEAVGPPLRTRVRTASPWRLTGRGAVMMIAAVALLVGGALWSVKPAAVTGVALVAAVVTDLVGAVVDIKLWQRRLRSGQRVIRPNPAVVGQIVTVGFVDVAQGSTGPLVTDVFPPALRALPKEQETAPAHVEATRRGVFEFGPLVGLRRGPLGLWAVSARSRLMGTLMVWPRLAEIAPTSRAIGEAQSGSFGVALQRPDDILVRDYQVGDEVKRIHWRSSARRGRLMTRVAEPVTTVAAHVHLGLLPTTPGALAELAISVAASVCVMLDHAGYAVTSTTGRETTTGHWRDHLDAFARLDVAGETRAQGETARLFQGDDATASVTAREAAGARAHRLDARRGAESDDERTTLTLAVVAGEADRGGTGAPIPGSAAAWADPDVTVALRHPAGPAGVVLLGGADAVARRLRTASWQVVSVPATASLQEAGDGVTALFHRLRRGGGL